jgi:uracil-DNA glycosylase family 4
MRWKLHPEVEERIPFDESFFQKNELSVTLFDEVEVTPISLNGSDKSFYCIDVEDTHNFVTSGGVVRNCRPPNNRSPLPEEIDNCIKFLKKQIEIISPLIIVLLGRTAANGILPEHKKISLTNLRKYSKENLLLYEGITVSVSYHPSALLRNPGYKDGAKEDFEYLKEQDFC